MKIKFNKVTCQTLKLSLKVKDRGLRGNLKLQSLMWIRQVKNEKVSKEKNGLPALPQPTMRMAEERGK